MVMNREQALLCEVWRRGDSESGYTITCKDKREAQRLRFALYNAVKFAREPGAAADAALVQAVEGCSIYLEQVPGMIETRLVVRRKALVSKLEGLLQAANGAGAGAGAEILAPEALAARQMAERLLKEVETTGKAAEQVVETGRVTPYYSRKD